MNFSKSTFYKNKALRNETDRIPTICHNEFGFFHCVPDHIHYSHIHYSHLVLGVFRHPVAKLPYTIAYYLCLYKWTIVNSLASQTAFFRFICGGGKNLAHETISSKVVSIATFKSKS